LPVKPSSDSHLSWVKDLAKDQVSIGVVWLQEIVDTFVLAHRAHLSDGTTSSSVATPANCQRSAELFNTNAVHDEGAD
jgi:hypothetical protein